MQQWIPQLKAKHWLILGILGLFLVMWVVGCPGSQSRRTAQNSQLLLGTWQASHEGFETIWIFTADGGLRWQSRAGNIWLQLIGANLDIPFRWRLVGDQLTIELLETPLQIALLGENWSGQQQTLRIKKLTQTELEFHESDFQFWKSLATP